jgi:integrase/recombinase XerD
LFEGRKETHTLSVKRSYKTILNMPKTDNQKERRNQMILILLYDSAARIQELVDLKLKDLHLYDKTPFITLTGKGNTYPPQEYENYYYEQLRESLAIVS